MTRTIVGLALAAGVLGTMLTTTGNAAVAPVESHRTVSDVFQRLAWTEQHIDKLNRRNDYLHRYIRDLRAEIRAPASVETTASTTTPDVAPAATGGWADELAAVGFPPEAIPTMLQIIDRESGGCPTAVNGLTGCPSYTAAAALLAESERHACGLIQAFPCYGGSAWLDPMANLRIGYAKYKASGLSPWSM